MGNVDLAAKNRLSSFIMLHHLLAKIPLIAQSISSCSCAILTRARENFEAPALDELRSILSEYLNADIFFAKGEVRLQTQRVQAIKTGLSGLVDAARTIHGENIQDIVDLYHHYVTKYPEYPNLKLRYEAKRGYFLSLPSKDLNQVSVNQSRSARTPTQGTLPAEFLQVSLQGGAAKNHTFTTAALASLSAKNAEIIQEILHLSDQLIDTAVAKIRQHVMALYAVADSIAYVDMLHAFAAYSKSDVAAFCLPKLFSLAATDNVSKNLHFTIFQGRHPIITSTVPATRGANREFVPTNFELLQPRSKSLMTVTGPNNSGKTTYITQVALNVVLAQIGCFIPAQSAIIPIFDKVFTRIGSQDSIERNASTFTMEMRDLALVLQNATSSSLVVMDELGRSTTPEEGEAIFFASCENLAQNRVVSLVSTHFHHMCSQLGAMYPGGVRNCQLAVEEADVVDAEDQQDGALLFRNLYIVQESSAANKISAIDVAQANGLHPELASEARRLRLKLKQHVQTSKRDANRVLNILKIKVYEEISKATLLYKEGKISAAALKDIVLHHRSRLLEHMGEENRS
jgi:DNA mismatch repair protein MSH4